MKPIVWVGSSKKDLRRFPDPVQRAVGRELLRVQFGGSPQSARVLRGFGGAGVLEIVEDHDSDTFRAVYTVKLSGAVYVLHTFQKKSRKRSETPKHVIELIRRRLAEAERIHRSRSDDMPIKKTPDGIEYEESSGNVFADLGLPNPEELMAKALLSIAIERAIEQQGLTRASAAELIQCTEDELSRVIRGDLSDFLMDHLFRYLNALGMDVRIEVTPKAEEAPEARVLVTAT